MVERPRILWLLNHKTLMPFEIPALISLGYEVFVPKVIPKSGFRSGAISYDYDHTLSIPRADLERLNAFNFYEGEWSPQIERVVNKYFACAFVMPYGKQVTEAALKFDGQIVFRAFGLDNKRTYRAVLSEMYGASVMDVLKCLGDRFWFGEGYTELREVEDDWFKKRAVYLPLGLPDQFFSHQDSWRGGKNKILFVSPNAVTDPYYAAVYSDFKRDFGDIPHVIVGHQDVPVDDDCMLGYVSEDEFNTLLQECSALYYHSLEQRHVHYPPIEAAIVGLPVVYYKDSLFDRLCPESTVGAASSVEEARHFLARILSGDRELIDAARRDQRKIVRKYERSELLRVWHDNIQGSGLGRAIEVSHNRSTFARTVLTFTPRRIREIIDENKEYFVPLETPSIAKRTLGSSIYDGVAFDKEVLPDFIYSISGISAAEPHGRWSDGERATIVLKHFFDRSFVLELTAFAYGANAGERVKVKIGGSVKTVAFQSDSDGIVPVRMTFSLRRRANRIEIKIPHPTQVSKGSRKIGLGFVKLQAHKVEPLSGYREFVDAMSCARSAIARSILAFMPIQVRQRLAKTKECFVPLESPEIAKSVLGSSIYDGVTFTDEVFPNFIYSVSGISAAESRGRWSDGECSVIVLKHALDKRFALELTAFAYGVNAGELVEVRIGGVVNTAIFQNDHANIAPVKMVFALKRPANRIEIKIPHPTQPPNDSRKVGVAFVSLQACKIDSFEKPLLQR